MTTMLGHLASVDVMLRMMTSKPERNSTISINIGDEKNTKKTKNVRVFCYYFRVVVIHSLA